MILVGTSCRCTDCEMSFDSSNRPWPSNEGLAVTAAASVNKNCKGVIVDESVTNPSPDARLTDDERLSAEPRLIWPKKSKLPAGFLNPKLDPDRNCGRTKLALKNRSLPCELSFKFNSIYLHPPWIFYMKSQEKCRERKRMRTSTMVYII